MKAGEKSSKRILIVDDDRAALRYIEALIVSLGFNALAAANREDCLQIVQDYKPGVIFLDIMLGDANGFDVCGDIKSNPDSDDPIIVLYSGMDFSPEDRRRGLEVGIDGYLNKRASIEEIKLSIQLYARLRESEMGLRYKEQDLTASVTKLNHINNVLRSMMDINIQKFAANGKAQMIREVCSALTVKGAYDTAWIGLMNEKQKFEYVEASGMSSEFNEFRKALEDGDKPDCVERLIGGEDVLSLQEYDDACGNCAFVKKKDSSSMAVKIISGEKMYGVISVTMPSIYLKDLEEQNLLKAVASELGAAIHNLFADDQITRLSSIVQTIPYPIALISDQYRYKAVNEIYSVLYDVPVDEIIGSRVEDFLGADFFMNNLKEKMDLCLSGGSISYEVEINFKTRGPRWMFLEYRPFYSSSERKPYIISSALDITERKRSELELEKKMTELEIFNDAAVNREILVNRLRNEINKLLIELGRSPKYRVVK